MIKINNKLLVKILAIVFFYFFILQPSYTEDFSLLRPVAFKISGNEVTTIAVWCLQDGWEGHKWPIRERYWAERRSRNWDGNTSEKVVRQGEIGHLGLKLSLERMGELIREVTNQIYSDVINHTLDWKDYNYPKRAPDVRVIYDPAGLCGYNNRKGPKWSKDDNWKLVTIYINRDTTEQDFMNALWKAYGAFYYERCYEMDEYALTFQTWNSIWRTPWGNWVREINLEKFNFFLSILPYSSDGQSQCVSIVGNFTAGGSLHQFFSTTEHFYMSRMSHLEKAVPFLPELIFIHSEKPYVVGVDGSNLTLNIEHFFLNQQKLAHNIVRALPFDLPFEDSSFDIAIVNLQLYLFPKALRKMIISEIKRTLSSDSVLIVIDQCIRCNIKQCLVVPDELAKPVELGWDGLQWKTELETQQGFSDVRIEPIEIKGGSLYRIIAIRGQPKIGFPRVRTLLPPPLFHITGQRILEGINQAA